MQEGNDMLTAKNFTAAAAAYDKVIAADPTDGVALLRKGMALSRTESAADMAKAVEAFKQAAANGQAEAADKQLSTISLKEAANALKSGKSSDALAAAKECMSYGDNPQACLVAAQAAQKLGKAEESISYFEKYLSIAPTAKNAGAITFTVAAMYQQAGNKAKALEYYQKIASDPKFGAQAAQQIAALKK
jgi:tetratricopeptide (TPR) repeat protein